MQLLFPNPLLLTLVTLLVHSSLSQELARTQESTPAIRVEVALVNLTATVVDRAGHHISGLKREDFEIYDEGTPQELAVFGNDEDIPVSMGVVFDTSGSMVDKIEDVRDAVTHFVNTVNANDDIFVMQFSSSVSLVQDFTSDRRRILQAVDRLRAQGSTSLYDGIISGLKHIRSGQHRRRALLVITDGNDTSSKIDLQEAIDSAIRSEVPVYCLGIGHGEHGSFGHDGGFKDAVDVDTLRAFSKLTGGTAFVLEGAHRKKGIDQIDQACQEVAAELRQQYTLGYYPKNIKQRGKYRRIQVKVKRNDLRVRARDGYFPDSLEEFGASKR